MTGKPNNQFVIGVDGGATKTHVVLADLDGKIVTETVLGPASPRDPGVKVSCRNIADGIRQVLKNNVDAKIVSTLIGMPRIQEEYKNRRAEIIEELKRNVGVENIFAGKVAIESDQIMTLRAGTDVMKGLAVIVGSGFSSHGWNGGKEAKIGGWGWLVSVGSGRWIGKEVYRHIVEAIDGRGPKTNLQEFLFKKFNLKNVDEFIDFIYEDPAVNLPKFSIVCDEAAIAGDAVSREILANAGKEIARSVIITAKQLDFNDGKIQTVIAGGVFNSNFFYDAFIDGLKKESKLNFLLIRCEAPVIGAVKMAIDNI